jgi:hypothetical protein
VTIRKIITKGVIDWATLKVESVETIDYSGPMALAAAPSDYLDTADLEERNFWRVDSRRRVGSDFRYL